MVMMIFFGKCCWNGLLASYVVVAAVLLTKTVSCDGVDVQWQNGDCVGLLWFWRCCAEPPLPFAVL